MREEVLLALEMYLRDGMATAEARQSLSGYLRSWPVEHDLTENPTFRNEQAVRNKLYNIQYLATEGRRGREKGGEVTQAVWEEFGADLAAVSRAATEVRLAFDELQATEHDDVADFEADESSITIRAHRTRERSRALVQRKREQVRSQTGRIACEACGFDSDAAWGVAGIIECHHTKPVSELGPGETTHLADLRLVCPNCHRLVHSSRPWLDWEQVLTIVRG